MTNTIRIHTINDEIIKPLPVEIDTRPVKGESICKEPYANIFLCAKKKSGKTLAIAHIPTTTQMCRQADESHSICVDFAQGQELDSHQIHA